MAPPDPGFIPNPIDLKGNFDRDPENSKLLRFNSTPQETIRYYPRSSAEGAWNPRLVRVPQDDGKVKGFPPDWFTIVSTGIDEEGFARAELSFNVDAYRTRNLPIPQAIATDAWVRGRTIDVYIQWENGISDLQQIKLINVNGTV
ncbi:MAG: hypothetical protein JXA30_03595 [Deltaproteobacteria bacterium]|nr:hypothetical protein [Deltaproteobacteria bacterium]